MLALVSTEEEFWRKELEKIQDPISGAYYFYINYIRIDREGNKIRPPFITERDFNKVFRKGKLQRK